MSNIEANPDSFDSREVLRKLSQQVEKQNTEHLERKQPFMIQSFNFNFSRRLFFFIPLLKSRSALNIWQGGESVRTIAHKANQRANAYILKVGLSIMPERIKNQASKLTFKLSLGSSPQ